MSVFSTIKVIHISKLSVLSCLLCHGKWCCPCLFGHSDWGHSWTLCAPCLLHPSHWGCPSALCVLCLLHHSHRVHPWTLCNACELREEEEEGSKWKRHLLIKTTKNKEELKGKETEPSSFWQLGGYEFAQSYSYVFVLSTYHRGLGLESHCSFLLKMEVKLLSASWTLWAGFLSLKSMEQETKYPEKSCWSKLFDQLES